MSIIYVNMYVHKKAWNCSLLFGCRFYGLQKVAKFSKLRTSALNAFICLVGFSPTYPANRVTRERHFPPSQRRGPLDLSFKKSCKITKKNYISAKKSILREKTPIFIPFYTILIRSVRNLPRHTPSRGR